MASNRINGACNSVPLSLATIITLMLVFTGNSNAQNISKYYTSSLQQSGTLYFILPQSGFRNNEIRSELTYDITYLTAMDNTVLNFSYYDKLSRDIDSIAFVGDEIRITSIDIKKIFVEPKKGRWHYRYSSNFLFRDLANLFNQSPPPKLFLYTKQGIVELNIKKKNWGKTTSVNKTIFTMIKHNQ